MLYAAQKIRLFLVVENSYFNDNDFTDVPIKKFLKSYSFQALEHQSMYYYMMISENDVYTSDFKLFGNEKFYTYVDTRMEYHEVRTLNDFQGSTNAFLSIYILLDN
jgi:hypothetical protein